jgi:predicted  nucleic acid-binding Zn-ribbon protein
MRANQISPVLNVIEKNYQDAIDRNTKLLYIIATIGTILAIVFFSFLTILLKQKKKLALAQQEVKKKNEELEASNHKLKWMNERVMKNNKQLFEINARLQEEKNGILDNSIPDQS